MAALTFDDIEPVPAAGAARPGPVMRPQPGGGSVGVEILSEGRAATPDAPPETRQPAPTALDFQDIPVAAARRRVTPARQDEGVPRETPLAESTGSGERGIFMRMGRGAGLAGRTVLQGAGNLAGFVADAGLTLADLPHLIADGLVVPADGGTPRPLKSLLGSVQRGTAAAADLMHLPQYEGTQERMVGRVGEEVTGAAATLGLGALMQGARLVGPGILRLADGARVLFGQGLRTLGRNATRTQRAGAVLADAPLAQLGGAAGSGVAGGTVHEAMDPDNPWRGPAELAASVVGGVAAPTAGVALPAAARAAGAYLAPFTAGGREAVVGHGLRQLAADPEGAIQRLRDRPAPLVPGSDPTGAEVAGDVGLLMAERGARSNTPLGQFGRFPARDAARDQARSGALAQVAPGPEDAQRVEDAVRFRLSQDQQAADLRERAARAGQGQAEAALPPGADGATTGAALRSNLEAGADASQAGVRARYEALRESDPAIPLSPIIAATERVQARLNGPLVPGAPEGEFDALLEALRSADPDSPHPSAPWSHVQDLLSWLGNAQGKAKMAGNNRLAAAFGEVRDAIDQATQTASEPVVPTGRPLNEADIRRGEADEAAGQHPDLAGEIRTGVPGASQQDARAAAREEKSLVQWLVETGGLDLRGDRGDLLSSIGTTRARPGLVNNQQRRRLVDPVTGRVSYVGGRRPEEALQAAIEQGFFDDLGLTDGPGGSGRGAAASQGAQGPGGPTIDDLHQAIADELAGEQPRYMRGEAPIRERMAGQDRARADLEAEVQRRGGSLEQSPEDTLRSLRQVEEPPGMDRPPEDALLPPPVGAMTPEQAAAFREARAARSQHGRDFEAGPVGTALKRDRYGNAATPDSAIPELFWRRGKGAVEAVDQFRRAAGNRAEADAALGRYAAQSLRDAATDPRTGDLVAGRVAAWNARHRDVLQMFPDVAARFANLQRATAEVERVLGANRATVAERETGVARYFLQRDPQKAVAGVLASTAPVREMRELVRLVGGDPTAMRGLRRAYVDELRAKLQSSVEVLGADGAPQRAMSQGTGQRFFEATRPARAVLFPAAQREALEAVMADFRAGQRVNTVGRASGSPTAQNLSLAYTMGRATNGLLDATGTVAGVFSGTIGKLLSIAVKLPAHQIEQLMFDAFLDPAVMQRLMEKARPDNIRALENLARKNGMENVAAAFGRALARTGVRAANSTAQGRGDDIVEERHASGGRVGMADGGDLGLGDGQRSAIEGFLDRSAPATQGAEDTRLRAARRRYEGYRIPYDDSVVLAPQVASPVEPRPDNGAAVQPNLTAQGERARRGRQEAPWPDRGLVGDALLLGSGGGAGLLGKAIMNGVGQAASSAGEGYLGPQGAGDVAVDAALAMPGGRAVRAGLAGAGFLGGSTSEAEGHPLDRMLRAFHGSPHVFDRFSTRYINTGEGAQAFGKGLYFAENEGIAQGYRTALTRRRWDNLQATEGGQPHNEPYLLRFDDEGEKLLGELHPEYRMRIRQPFGDLSSVDNLIMDLQDGSNPMFPDEINASNYHRPDVMREAHGMATFPLDMVEEDLSGLRRGDDSQWLDENHGIDAASAERQMAAVRGLQSRPSYLEPNLGASYEVQMNADPGAFLNLDGQMNSWDQPEAVRRALQSRNWGPQTEQALFSDWNRLDDPRQRITGAEAAFMRDAGPWAHRVDRAGLSPRGSEILDGHLNYGSRSLPETAEGIRTLLQHADPDRMPAGDLEHHQEVLRRIEALGPPEDLFRGLAQAGIPGSRFLDAGSRRGGSNRTHNLVMFDETPIELKRRYSVGGKVGGLG